VEQTNEREIKRDMNFLHYFAWLFRVYVALGIVNRFFGIFCLSCMVSFLTVFVDFGSDVCISLARLLFGLVGITFAWELLVCIHFGVSRGKMN
jgi:hypothetical protein